LSSALHIAMRGGYDIGIQGVSQTLIPSHLPPLTPLTFQLMRRGTAVGPFPSCCCCCRRHRFHAACCRLAVAARTTLRAVLSC